MLITFFVDAAPIAQPRQRHAVRNGIAVNYVPKTHPVVAFKQIVKIRARQAYQGEPLTGPLRVSLLFLLPRPQRLVWKTKPMPRVWATCKPDRDNAEKAVLDSLSGIVFVDDAQVCDGWIQKKYAAGHDEPGVMVTIETLE